jgi:hypothetical protein
MERVEGSVPHEGSPVSFSHRHPMVWRAAKIVLGMGLAFVAFVGVAAVVLASCLSNLNFGHGRKHLKAIPIPASACPYIRRLHVIADDVQSNEPLQVLDVDLADLTKAPLAWPAPSRKHYQRFRRALAALDNAITASNPHFPRVLRRYLAHTQHDVQRGRIEIAHTFYGLVRSHPATDLLSNGQENFGYASDLVGTQCGGHLAADTNTMPDLPFLLIPPDTSIRPHAHEKPTATSTSMHPAQTQPAPRPPAASPSTR